MWSNAMNSKWIFTLVVLLFSTGVLSENEEPAEPDIVTPTVEIGAEVFSQRCILCHGNVGMGEGIIATSLKDYPPTNLRKNKYGVDNSAIKAAIIYGGERGAMNNAMPPFGDELTWLEIESTAKFMSLYYRNVEKAVALIKKYKVSAPPKRELGRVIFQRRCIFCHGKKGDGKGKMAKVINNPPPFNLTLSIKPDDYLFALITTGGEKMGRSPKMPPFGDELTENDIRSIILYIKKFRTL